MTANSILRHCSNKQVSAVMVTTACIVAAMQIGPSYSPGGVSVHCTLSNDLLGPCESPSNDISIGSSIFAGLTVMTNTQTIECQDTSHI